MVTPVVRGDGRAKLIAFIVTFALHAEQTPLGLLDESAPGVPGLTCAPDDGDAR